MNKHLTDKEMVNDILASTNASLTKYAGVISETANQQLRQTIQQIRNSDEQFQYQVFRMAEQKGFYKPAAQVDSNDIQTVKSQISS